MKNKFIKEALILIAGGFITKILAMVIKICLTRAISTKGIGLYMLILPTFNLFITLCTLSLTTSTSKLVSENKKRSRKIILPLIPISLIYNFLLMIIVIILAPLISNVLLKNPDTYYPIMAISLTLPFICLSGILRGYFFGKQNMFPQVLSNIIEQIIRLILTIYFIPSLLKYSLVIAVTGVVLINIISEFISCLVLLLFMPKNEKINIHDFKPNREILLDILNISIPTTGSRLIGSIAYFFEPIIITFVLLHVGYNNNFITTEYGIINGYVYALLLLPSFFTMAISNALLPVLSNSWSKRKYTYAKSKLNQGIFFSLIIGLTMAILFMSIPEILLKFIFNTNLGVKYILVAAPFVLFHYIQSPLTTMLQAMNKANIAMRGTLYGSILKSVLLFGLCFLKIGLWPLIIASSFNILFVTIHHYYYVNKYIKEAINN